MDFVVADMRRRVKNPRFQAAPHLPGEFHPRVWRNGCFALHPISSNYPAELVTARRRSVIATHQLLDRLASIFEIVEPDSRNLATFGAAIRQLLIVACTEVEASWVGILRANGYAMSDRLGTRDYVKLLAPLRLDEWKVAIPFHAETWPSISPFQTWSASDPTRSLPWYAAYNATKHDREISLDKATLNAVVSSIAAVWILLIAQFGGGSPDMRSVTEHRIAFDVIGSPVWSSTELYFPAEEVGFRSVPLPL